MTTPPHVILPNRHTLRLGVIVIGAYLLALGTIALFVRLDAASRLVAWPSAVMIAAIAGMIITIRIRDCAASYFEVGVIYAGILGMYAIFPPVIIIVRHFQFSPDRDGRFSAGQPTPQQIASIAWWYAIYVVVYCVVYLIARPRHSVRTEPILRPGRAIPVAVLILLVLSKVFAVFVAWRYGSGASYSDTYLIARSLPTLWRQLSNVFEGMEGTLKLTLLAALFWNYRRLKWVIALFLGAIVISVVLSRGARTEAAVMVIAAMLFYDILVRRISAKTIAIAAVAGFVLFMVMGALRQVNDSGLTTFQAIGTASTDFEGIFTNAWDLKYLEHQSGAFRGDPQLLFADVAGLVPQQLLPFRKTSAALWYISTFYPVLYAAGGGLAFGVVAEAVVGYGIVQLILCAMFAGLFLGLVQRWYLHAPVGVLSLAFYAWITVFAYQMCRNTTLSIFSQTLDRFVPAVLATLLIAAALRRGSALRRRIFSNPR